MKSINDYIAYIQREIAEKDRYQDYVHAFEEYEDYLEARLSVSPKDIEVICQLAAVYHELRYDYDDCISPMEEALQWDISEGDRARLYTNLAFYHEEQSPDDDVAMRYLEAAVALAPDTPNAYDALGRFVLDSDPERSLALYRRAYELSDEMKYHYNYAVALFTCGKIAEARRVLELLPAEGADDERLVRYAMGVCDCYLGDREAALAAANALAAERSDDQITEGELADLYFLCGAYERHNAMYDTASMRYVIYDSWMAPYLYSLKMMGETNKMEKTFAESIAEKDAEIASAKTEELDADYTLADRDHYVLAKQKERDDIAASYAKIMESGCRPQIKIKLWPMFGCYLLDCPRHQPVENVSKISAKPH
ncbi:MAG: hypothetical protein LBK56_07750 [Gracilibacteraceae bacterium]|jgi:tetratricopeptide (TPR) repeat protein|nr:hypothetical protein [Gracilibacteraceae bacterium]